MGAGSSVGSSDDAVSLQLAEEISRDRERAERIWRAANQIAGVSGTLAREDQQRAADPPSSNGPGGTPEWVATVDPASGNTYYWNEATGETRWSNPADADGTTAGKASADDPASGAPSAVAASMPAPALSDEALCRAVFDELNAARTDPAAYASKVEGYLELLGAGGDPLCMHDPERAGEKDAPLLKTKEGAAAVRECAEALRKLGSGASGGMPAVAAFTNLSAPLSLAAAEHAADIGASGATSHDGADGSAPQDRIERHGEWAVTLGENLSFGCRDASRIVCQLLIDDGVPSRGHRENTLNPRFTVVGIAVAPHAVYGTCCVVDFVGGYGPKRQVSDQAASVESAGSLSAAFLAVMESVPTQISEQLLPLCEQAIANGDTVTIVYDPNGEVQIRCKSDKQERVTQASWGVTAGEH